MGHGKHLGDEVMLRSEDQRQRRAILGSLSYELRNPLAALSSCLYVLKRSHPGGLHATRALAVMERQIRQLAFLADALTETAAPHGLDLGHQPATVDLCELVREAIADHESFFASSAVEVRAEVPVGPIWTPADPMCIAQILGTLLQGAVRFVSPGGKVGLALDHDASVGIARIQIRDRSGSESPGPGASFQVELPATGSEARTIQVAR